MSSTNQKTALKFLDAFETLSSDLLTLRTPTCCHTFAPVSITPPTHLDNAKFEAHLNRLREVIRSFPVKAKEIMEDQAQNRVIVWATSRAEFFDELRDNGIPNEEWMFESEYVWFFTLDQSGEKIERIVEFLDSKTTDRGRMLIKRAMANKTAIDGGVDEQ
jgi:hypothetical protein